MSLIQMSQIYQERPSSLLEIEDPYTSFCLDEACAYIIAMVRDGKKPLFKKETKQAIKKHGMLPSEIYEHYEVR